MTSKRIIPLLLFATFILGGWWIWIHRVVGQQAPTQRPAIPLAGNPAPAFTLTTLEGNELQLADLHGQAVVLNFWASWCGPCRAEMPELEQAFQEYREQGLIVLGVNQGEDPATVRGFLQQLGLSFPVVLDQQLQVSQLYHVNSLPSTFFIDRNGIIRDQVIGQMNTALLSERLRSIYP